MLWPTFITSGDEFRKAIAWDGPEGERDRESLVLEFKGGPVDQAKLTQRINGMANANGGVILVGVIESNTEIKYADGLRNIDNADDYKDEVMQLVDTRLKPRPQVDPYTFSVDGCDLVAFNVTASLPTVAYEEHDGGHYILRYFVRRETHTRSMNAGDVERHMFDSNRSRRMELLEVLPSDRRVTIEWDGWTNGRMVLNGGFADVRVEDVTSTSILICAMGGNQGVSLPLADLRLIWRTDGDPPARIKIGGQLVAGDGDVGLPVFKYRPPTVAPSS